MEKYLFHHGIKGQKWGVQNGPPYPLNISKSLGLKVHKTVMEKEKKITNDVKNSASLSNGKLYGLKNRLKTFESIERKIRKK